MSKNNRQNRDKKLRQRVAKQKARASSRTPSTRRINITLPEAITDEIEAFCSELVPLARASYVDVKPAPKAVLNDCFVNVHRFAERNGGSICYGWLILEWPGALLEAMFHAVWRAADGELLDVTPTADGECRILFLPDDTRTYAGEQVLSRQRPLPGAPAEAALYIEACQAVMAFEASRFVDDGVDGQVSMSDADLWNLQRLKLAAHDAQRRLVAAVGQTNRPEGSKA